MANPRCNISSINNFIIDNFIPHAWAEMWELDGIDTDDVFRFVMEVRPNCYERIRYEGSKRLFTSRHQDSNGRAGGKYWQYQLPHHEHDSEYRIRIPMILENSTTKNGKLIDEDKKMKDTYLNHLAKSALEESQKLENPPPFEINKSRDIVFGKYLSKVKAYIKNNPREQWAFI